MKSHLLLYTILQFYIFISLNNAAQTSDYLSIRQKYNENVDPKSLEPTIQVQCLSKEMIILIKNAPQNQDSGLFSGMVYPKGLSKNSSCLAEYRNHKTTLKYKLPLRSCNTMPQETDDGDIEFFNIIVLQPHLKLVTGLERGFHIRCRYKSRDVATKIASKTNPEEIETRFYHKNDNEKISALAQTTNRRDHARSFIESKIYLNPDGDELDDQNINILNDKPMPGCHMKIYNGDSIAENVKIGDMLKLVVNIDDQEIYGFRVTDCLVRDGLGWGEQNLINSDGCPMDNEIMGSFEYSENRKAATVTFPAHKFPYTSSVYYQCNVNLCAYQDTKCHKSPMCDETSRNKRQATGTVNDTDGTPATIEVYSGLYVNENAEVVDSDDSVSKTKASDESLCISQRTFAIAIAIAGLLLMLAVVAAVLCIMAKRRTKNASNPDSSIYSGPYSNTAFSHSS